MKADEIEAAFYAGLLGFDANDPAMVASFLPGVNDRLDRMISFPCAWGTCIADYDPIERRITGGMGVAGCGCDNLPGWNARHPEGRPKPAAAVKARGRHGSRVQRSRHRRREWPAMLRELDARYGS